MKKTKILCTLGPASESRNVIKRMTSAGMDAVRVNTAHGSFEQYEKIISNLRSVKDIPVILDIKGPEIRIKTKTKIRVGGGEEIRVGFNKESSIYLTHDIRDEIRVGDRILIADGLIEGRVLRKKQDHVILKIKNGGVFEDNKGANIPGRHFNIPSLSEKDRSAIEFAKEKDLDYIALSFTRNREDVVNLKRLLRGSGIDVIAKIENKEGLDNLDEIIQEADGIMVARGDLGVELPSEKLPIIQKNVIRKCNTLGRVVVVATEMLKSMVESSRPTRAETSDIANAALDGADAVMLSEETAVGKHPAGAVDATKKILVEVEPYIESKILSETQTAVNINESIAKATYEISQHLPVDKIITLTRSGHTARLIARFRLKRDVIAVTPSQKVGRKLGLVYGVTPVLDEHVPDDEKIPYCAKILYERGFIRKSDVVLFTAGVYTEKQHTNLLQAHRVSELIEYSSRMGSR